MSGYDYSGHLPNVDVQEKKEKQPLVYLKKMATNCGPDYRLGKVTTFNHFQCNYLGSG